MTNKTQTGPAFDEVNELAQKFVDDGKFKTVQEARNYVFESRPELAERVRAETTVVPDGSKREPSATEAKVEEVARAMVAKAAAAGKPITIQQARAAIYESNEPLTKAVRGGR